MRARIPRSMLLVLSFLLLAPAGAAAEERAPFGTIGQEGTQLPSSGVPELYLGGRFLPQPISQGVPSMALRFGAWSGGTLGLRYSSAGQFEGNPHELEFSLKQRLWSEAQGAPLTASLLGAVNTGAYSLDGELALSRELGPLTLLGTTRLLGNADGARLPLAGLGVGAHLALWPHVALVGDIFQVVNHASAIPAWGAGVQLQLPSTPYAWTFHVTNTPSSTRQAASLGTSDLRFGVDMRMALPSLGSRALFSPRTPERSETPSTRTSEEPDSAREAAGGAARDAAAADSVQGEAPRVSSSPKPEATLAPVKPSEGKPPVAKSVRPATRTEGARPGASAAAVKPKASPTPAPSAKPKARPSLQKSGKSPEKSQAPQALKRATAPGATASKAVETHSDARRESELWIVMIREGQPSPAQVSLHRQSSISWLNRDATPHAWVGKGWASGVIAPGASYTQRFDHVGSYTYHCEFHPGEGGTILVR